MNLIAIDSEVLQRIESRIVSIHSELSQQKKDLKNPIYNNDEVCQLLKISKRTLQSWRDKGIIQFSQINGTILYSQANIEELLERYSNKVFTQHKNKSHVR